MQRILIILMSLAAAVAILLIIIAVLLICAPELLVTNLRVAAIIACGIAGIGILAPVIIFTLSSIFAKNKNSENTNS